MSCKNIARNTRTRYSLNLGDGTAERITGSNPGHGRHLTRGRQLSSERNTAIPQSGMPETTIIEIVPNMRSI